MNQPEVELKSVSKWRRFMLRANERALWHVHGILLWLLRRPFLRCLPLPYPAVGTVKDWDKQMSQMLEAGAISKRCAQKIKADKLMTSEALRDCCWLRDRLGLRVAFMEDPILPGLLAARGVKGLATKIKEAAAREEKEKARQIREKGQHLNAVRELIGPRGGLPHLRGDLVKLAALLQLNVPDKSTIDELKTLIKPVVQTLVGSMAKPDSRSSSSQQAPKPAPKAKAPPKALQAQGQDLQRVRQEVRQDMRAMLDEQSSRFQEMMFRQMPDGRTVHDLAFGDDQLPHQWDDFESLEGPWWEYENTMLAPHGWTAEEVDVAMAEEANS